MPKLAHDDADDNEDEDMEDPDVRITRASENPRRVRCLER